MPDSLYTYFNWNDVPGHISYLIIAISYYLTRMFWLRLMAVIGLFMEILYFVFTSDQLYTGIGWDLVFIAINLYQLYWLIIDRIRMRLPGADSLLLKQVLNGLDSIQIARLLKVGEWQNLEPGVALTREHKPVAELYCLISGRASVLVNETLIAHLNTGAFIGEIAFLTGQTATATVVIDQPARLLVFKKEKLHKIFAQDEQLSLRIHRLIGSDLAGKLRIVNSLHLC
jgi:hypothetical protein